MTKDKKEWECLGASSFKIGINLVIAHFLLALFIFLVKKYFLLSTYFSYSVTCCKSCYFR